MRQLAVLLAASAAVALVVALVAGDGPEDRLTNAAAPAPGPSASAPRVPESTTRATPPVREVPTPSPPVEDLRPAAARRALEQPARDPAPAPAPRAQFSNLSFDGPLYRDQVFQDLR